MRYGAVAQALHWLTAALLAGSFTLGLTMVGLDLGPRKLALYSWHKWCGVTVLALTALRLAWRLRCPPPPFPPTMPRWQRGMARLSHGGLYALLFAVPLAGWTMSSALGVPTVWLGLAPLPDLVAPDRALGDRLAALHGGLALALLALVALHVGAALHHGLVARDGVLHRMLPALLVRGRRS